MLATVPCYIKRVGGWGSEKAEGRPAPNTPAFQRDRRPSVGRRCGSMGEGKNKSPTVVLDPGGPKAPLQLMRKLPKADIAKSRVHTCNSHFAHSKVAHIINNNNLFPRVVSTESVENKLAYEKHADRRQCGPQIGQQRLKPTPTLTVFILRACEQPKK